MTKYNLSIIVPAAPSRMDRLKQLISRLSINKVNHPKINFELIVIDGNGEYKDICQSVSRVMPVKYVYTPLDDDIYAPSYKRNVGFRVAEGDIFTMVDIDHFLSEHFIQGAIEPFKTERNLLNTGYMIDTCKSELCSVYGQQAAEEINEILMDDEGGLDQDFIGLLKSTKIPEPRPWDKVWLAAYPSEKIFEIRGYSEVFCKTGYSSEDDLFYYALKKSGLKIYNKEYERFAGVHLWHPASYRSQNQQSKKYLKKMLDANIPSYNHHEWGKLIKDGFIIRENKTLDFEKTELLINSLGRKSYSKPWQSFNDLLENINE